MSYSTWSYGDHKDQFVRVWKPALKQNKRSYSSKPPQYPIVFIVHGGFWKQKWTVDSAGHTSLAPDIVQRGLIAAEVEYRRCENGRPCWPVCNEDIVQAIKRLTSLQTNDLGFSVDWSRVVLVGHSAGGTLVLWATSRFACILPLTRTFQLKLVVALAPVTDLELGVQMKLSDEGNAIQNYLGGTPEAMPQIYRQASPIMHAGNMVTTPLLLVCGTKDIDVPLVFCERFHAELIDLNAKSPVVLLRAEDEDHYDIVSAKSSSWKSVSQRIVQACK